MSGETLKVTEEGWKTKCSRHKERFAKLNVEVQKIVKKEKNECMNEQCQPIEDNNGKRKIRDHFKKIGEFFAFAAMKIIVITQYLCTYIH